MLAAAIATPDADRVTVPTVLGSGIRQICDRGAIPGPRRLIGAERQRCVACGRNVDEMDTVLVRYGPGVGSRGDVEEFGCDCGIPSGVANAQGRTRLPGVHHGFAWTCDVTKAGQFRLRRSVAIPTRDRDLRGRHAPVGER